jgi:hypothetical protein
VTPPRTLHLTNPLEHGPDVRAAQRLLADDGYLPKAGIDGVFGPQTAEACRDAKFALGYPEHLVRPSCGAKLIGYLGGGPLPADYLKRAQERKNAGKGELAIRRKAVDYCEWALKNEPEIHYEQARPMRGLAVLKHLPVREDCSEFATKALKYGGAPDPNGLDYSGLGYTGTMLSHLPQITLPMVKPADLVVFGRFPGHHVCVVMEEGADPWLCSHGQEAGPIKVRFSVERTFQPNVVAWLRAVPTS